MTLRNFTLWPEILQHPKEKTMPKPTTSSPAEGPARTDKDTDYARETRMIHGRMHTRHWQYSDHIVPPVSASSAYRLESFERGAAGFQQFAAASDLKEASSPILIYDRLEEPSRAMLEERLADAEGGGCCVTFSTGMAAISAALGVLVGQGDTIVCHRTIYGCTFSLLTEWLPRFGVRTRFVDLTDRQALIDILANDESVRVVYGESPVNPNLELLDLAEIAAVVGASNARRPAERSITSVLDSTFATPFCQRPIDYGIDVVVHSLTKNIGGFGTDMGGAVVASTRLESDLLRFRKDFGAVLSPRAAWPTLVYGLPTLPVRAHAQMRTAGIVAETLEQHPLIAEVRYPGLPSHPQHALARRQMRDFDGTFAPGSLIYLVLAGSPRQALARGKTLVDLLAHEALTVTLAVSLGQIRTLVEHPASMTHAAIPIEEQRAQGIDPGGVRLSIGLESAEDIIADLAQAFARLEDDAAHVA